MIHDCYPLCTFLLNKNFAADVARRPRKKMQRPLLKRNNRVVSSEQLSNEKNMLPTYGYIGDEIVQLGMFVYGYLWVIAVYLGYMLPSYVGVEINHLPTGMILQVFLPPRMHIVITRMTLSKKLTVRT